MAVTPRHRPKATMTAAQSASMKHHLPPALVIDDRVSLRAGGRRRLEREHHLVAER